MYRSPLPEKYRYLSAFSLRFCAMTLMLCDHLWASIIPGNDWMTMLGRLAFPIFAFQIAEGYVHTSNYNRYVKRLFLFALLSEIPFNLFYISSPFFPFHQNVLFTLLLGLLSLRQIDSFQNAENFRTRIRSVLMLLLFLLLSVILFPDYGIRGVLTVIAFYLFRNASFYWLWQFAAMVLLNIVGFEGMQIPITLFGAAFEIPQQSFAVLSLLFIWCYNGKKGIGGKAAQFGFYAFYPLHMLILYLIRLLP